jgi:hypothetical protein
MANVVLSSVLNAIALKNQSPENAEHAAEKQYQWAEESGFQLRPVMVLDREYTFEPGIPSMVIARTLAPYDNQGSVVIRPPPTSSREEWKAFTKVFPAFKVLEGAGNAIQKFLAPEVEYTVFPVYAMTDTDLAMLQQYPWRFIANKQLSGGGLKFWEKDRDQVINIGSVASLDPGLQGKKLAYVLDTRPNFEDPWFFITKKKQRGKTPGGITPGQAGAPPLIPGIPDDVASDMKSEAEGKTSPGKKKTSASMLPIIAVGAGIGAFMLLRKR